MSKVSVCVKSCLLFLLFEVTMPISNEEAYDMLAVYFECMQNSNVAAKVYVQRFPGRRRYGKGVFTRLAQRLRATGSVRRPKLQRKGKGCTEGNVINILASIENNPHISIRSLSKELGITQGTVHNILKSHR